MIAFEFLRVWEMRLNLSSTPVMSHHTLQRVCFMGANLLVLEGIGYSDLGVDDLDVRGRLYTVGLV